MQDVLVESLKKIRRTKVKKTRMIAILLVLSLIVSLDVFWWLKQPGLTLAGDADCGIVEHVHDDGCQSGKTPCELKKHTHDISCYSDDKADVETQLDWQKMFANYPYTKNLRSDLVGIAKTQVGYKESELNFQVGNDGVRRGYTRYGEWYGVPYTDWSAVFVSFCLHYAGADSSEAPGNSGANSMAEMWKDLDKYASVDEYTPVDGDLVFFKNNTVGIITEVHNSVFYVVRGDIDGAVKGDVISLTDSSVAGWGSTVGTIKDSELPTNEELLDISNGPAFFIFEGGKAPKQKRSTFKMSRAINNLTEYLDANGGSYFFTLIDTNNQELPKDANGNYIVEPDTRYKLAVSFTSPEGFLPGTYQYQVPNGLLVDGGSGTFVLKDGVNVGDWEVTEDGLVTINFNEHMNSRTEITISATMGIHFSEQDEPIDFDGKISVTVQKPEVEKEHTKLNKWGSPGTGEGQDPTKIYWTVEIQGKEGSNIPGSIITDHIKVGDHHFTQSDMEGGLHFGVGEYDLQTGVQIAWHAWDVSLDDPNLEWTETDWVYKIPESVMCKWCPTPITLGNDGWIYYVEYTTTPEYAGMAGTVWYTNEVIIDGQYMEGWGSFEHEQAQANIIKNGTFHSDAEGGSFHWEFQATVPGKKTDEKAVYLWRVMDNLRVKSDSGDIIGYITNDSDHSIVTGSQGGNTFNVPNVEDATDKDEYAWYNMWSSDHGDGIYYARALVLLCRCHCTKDNCQFWGGSCGSQYWYEADDGYWYTNGMCHCWTTELDTTLNFYYETDDPDVLEKYGGQGNDLQNEVLLQNTTYLPDGTANTINVGSSVANVPIPGVFKKELIHDFNGYTAHYKVTVNEGKLVLTDGTPITIHDVMTETMVYISGSLVITAEDVNGNVTTLKQGEDYTITYDGTGGATDSHGKPVHVLDIKILRPQPVMYTLDYDTTLSIPDEVTEAIKYTNSASITLWGEQISDTTAEKVYADINISAKNYKVQMYKTCAMTGEPLGGATFGLYNEQGGLITTGVTDTKGELLFQSNLIEGIILREHILYYMQEIKAPPGYQLDDTKYWFCFCNETNSICKTCNEILTDVDARRIPFEQIGKVHAVNQLMNYDLPATGGTGVYPLILVSVIFIVTPIVYRFIRRRKRERRGVG